MKRLLLFLVSTLAAIDALHAQPAFRQLSSDNMRQELTLLRSTLITLHPGLYRYQTPGQVDSLFLAYNRRLEQPLPQARYFILLSQLLTAIRCGHTYPNYWNQPKAVRQALFSNRYLPFLFRIINGKLVITHNLSDNNQVRAGDEIQAINKHPVRVILDSLLTVSPADGLHGLARKLDNISIEPLDADTTNYNLFDIYLPLFFQTCFNTAVYSVTVKPFGSKKTRHLLVKALSKSQRFMNYTQRYGPLPVHQKNWSLTFLTRQTAWFRIGDFETWEWKRDYKPYLDSLFRVLQQRHVTNLIVDIRGNSGGDDEARDEVLSYLVDKPFGCADRMERRYRFLSIPDSLLMYLKSWNQSATKPKDPLAYQQDADGWYTLRADRQKACEPIVPKRNGFRGRKFLLINTRNSSTSFTLAKRFQREQVGPLIGEPTGGNQQGLNGGQFVFLRLPHSSFEIDIPLIWGAYPGPEPDTGIEPTHLVRSTAADYRSHNDPQIRYALALLKKYSHH